MEGNNRHPSLLRRRARVISFWGDPMLKRCASLSPLNGVVDGKSGWETITDESEQMRAEKGWSFCCVIFALAFSFALPTDTRTGYPPGHISTVPSKSRLGQGVPACYFHFTSTYTSLPSALPSSPSTCPFEPLVVSLPFRSLGISACWQKIYELHPPFFRITLNA